MFTISKGRKVFCENMTENDLPRVCKMKAIIVLFYAGEKRFYFQDYHHVKQKIDNLPHTEEYIFDSSEIRWISKSRIILLK